MDFYQKCTIVIGEIEAPLGAICSCFEGALKRKYLVSLLCLLIFVAAVDTIPDPPAISPAGSHVSLVAASHVQGPSSRLEKEWSLGIFSPRPLAVNWFSIRHGFEYVPASAVRNPLVFHATDASPPVLS